MPPRCSLTVLLVPTCRASQWLPRCSLNASSTTAPARWVGGTQQLAPYFATLTCATRGALSTPQVCVREALSLFSFGFTAAAGASAGACRLGMPAKAPLPHRRMAYAYDQGGIPSARLARTPALAASMGLAQQSERGWGMLPPSLSSSKPDLCSNSTSKPDLCCSSSSASSALPCHAVGASLDPLDGGSSSLGGSLSMPSLISPSFAHSLPSMSSSVVRLPPGHRRPSRATTTRHTYGE